jgi:flagellar biosynthesis/type III secretory pathway protein FliH
MLEESRNPFATVVMAHLRVLESKNDLITLKRWKVSLIHHLYDIGYEEKDIIRLFRFIDWLIKLPEELENEFWIEIKQYEEERRMQYVTSVERIGIKKGIEQGIEKGIEIGMKQGILSGIEFGMELKFGSESLQFMPEISKIEDINVLKVIQTKIKTAKTLDEIKQIYQGSVAD